MPELTREEVAAMVELTEAAAMASWFHALPLPFQNQTGVQVFHIGNATGTLMAAVNGTLLNRVVGLGIEEPVEEQQLDELIDFYRAGAVDVMVQLSPLARPPDLVAWLTARGFRQSGNWVKMYRSTGVEVPAVTTDLRIEQIGRERATDYGAVAEAGFGQENSADFYATRIGQPDWRSYLAYDGERPVAMAALFLNGKVGSLYGAATLPGDRNRGAQSALIAQRIKEARDGGCDWVTIETGEETPAEPNPSYRNMVRFGFQLAYARPNYILAAGKVV